MEAPYYEKKAKYIFITYISRQVKMFSGESEVVFNSIQLKWNSNGRQGQNSDGDGNPCLRKLDRDLCRH